MKNIVYYKNVGVDLNSLDSNRFKLNSVTKQKLVDSLWYGVGGEEIPNTNQYCTLCYGNTKSTYVSVVDFINDCMVYGDGITDKELAFLIQQIY